jgi:molybdate transport system ATP-binding protein
MSIEIRFRIDQGDFLLEVDLSLPSQGVSSLFGPSGCGKTTLLRAIAGLEQHRNCFLKVGDMVWQKGGHFVPPHQRPLGYVFQEASLFPHLNVRRNLEYGVRRLPESERRIPLEQAIELLEIGSFLERKPDTLSGGERQRVAIARALAVSPKLLLMDEPLAALDVNRKQEILPYFESLHRELDIPVIHVSHSPDEVARLADHLVLLDSGRVVASGDVHDIFTRLDLPPALESDAAAVIEAVVAVHDETYHLTCLDFAGGRVTVPREDLEVGARVRLKLAARDVSLTLEHQSDTSILNIFPAVIDEIMEEGSSQVTVRLLAGDVPILARITRKSASDLNLHAGMRVYAQVKSVALLS